ncbi:hypothetical protein NQ314_005442 [Rhamnusium bicolor]|uniref:PiggyBac transposable element-derived protein domain-containing protein n=1 Tax=Rhamnusium bicolor TaxID=1586634 RepID=A0AAV8ZJT5_9CUCU|nr:hypothetical protein NQ314_005442 [Rhamnusium bicolor]
MSKRRKIFTSTELEKIPEELDLEASSASDFGSDDSVRDPEWGPSSDPHGSSDEEVHDDEDDIENVIQNLAMEETARDQDELDDEVITSESVWSEYVGRHKTFPFSGPHGVQRDLPVEISPLESFFLILDNEVINHIVTETNRFAEQTIASKEIRKYARISKWAPTDADELKKFLGLTLWMGLG